eukprot:760226-Hanusia_phi.AAC.6
MAVPPGSSHGKARSEEDLPRLLRREIDMHFGDNLREFLRSSGQDGHSEPLVISSYNNKGGVLKTTTCVEVGFMLADMGFNILLVDLDSQGSLTKSLLHLDQAVDDVTFRTRIRVDANSAAVQDVRFRDNLVRFSPVSPLDAKRDQQNVDESKVVYKLADRNQSTMQAIRWELLDGLTEIARPEEMISAPERVTSFLIQSAGPNTHIVECDAQFLANSRRSSNDPGRRPEPKKAFKVQKEINKTRRPDQGSIHLIIGHHDTNAMSDRIAVANTKRDDPPYQRIHGSINWLIRQAARDVNADIVLVDLNPDSSQLNRTVIMQSDYVLLSTWPDPDGVESIVDLNCRLIKGLRFRELPASGVKRNPLLSENKESWIQMQQDLFHVTQKERIISVRNPELRVSPKMPILLGVLIHSKEAQRDIVSSQRKYADDVRDAYATLMTDLREHACVIVRLGEQLQAHHLRSRPKFAGGSCNMTLGDYADSVSVLGGIWNHVALKSLSKALKKPISNLNILDVSAGDLQPRNGGGEDAEAEMAEQNNGSGSKDATLNLLQIAEHRIRVHRIARAMLHNISLSVGQLRPLQNMGSAENN